MLLSCTVSEIRRLIGWKLRIFLPLSYLAPSLPMFPLEFRGEVNREETRVMGLPGGESCMILTSSVFDWSTHVTDRQTDRQTDGQTDGRAIAYTRYSIYAVARKNSESLPENIAVWRPRSGWRGYRWNSQTANYGSKVHLFRQWMATNCAALPTANAGQYATSHCIPLLFWFPCKWQYINVRTFLLNAETS